MNFRKASAAIALVASSVVSAHAEDSAGLAAYMAECSKCHGVPQQAGGQQPTRVLVAALGPLPAIAGLVAPNNNATPADQIKQLAVVLPYGPNLRGVIGRPAGSVPDFIYSKNFLTALKGKVWDALSLNEYIKDSQKYVRGSRMYYRQADESIRTNIVDFLSTYR